MTDRITFDDILDLAAKLPLGPPPPCIVTSHCCREQFRFPRTKKRRIRRKWAKRPENWRPITNRVFQIRDGCILCHPSVIDRIPELMAAGPVPAANTITRPGNPRNLTG